MNDTKRPWFRFHLSTRPIVNFPVLAILLNLPGILFAIPFPLLQMLALIPLIFWINIPAIPLSIMGVPYYPFKEFGALPQGTMGWLLIVIFWVIVAFVISWRISRRSRKIGEVSK